MNFLPLFFSNKYNEIKRFFTGISLKDEKLENRNFKQIDSYSYIDPNFTVDQKIEFEKRRRYQAYKTLDYLLCAVSYFDFFSVDSFRIAKKSTEFAQLLDKKIVTSDFLLLPFFSVNQEIACLLEKYGITENEVTEIIWNSHKIVEEETLEEMKKSFKKFFLSIDIPLVSERLVIPKETKYSYEINQLFEKAAENAFTRFKTPVINSEILLITMLEAKKSKVGKLLKQFLKTDTNVYTLRYSLMKRLHSQELAIRTDVPKNYQYFAYLLKTQLSELQFQMLIEKDCLLPGILLFRNNMIGDIMSVDLDTILKKDILLSIKANRNRKYSL